MPNLFQALEPFSFANIEFPWKTYEISGGLRTHLHEYPHIAGAAVEKLGRKLYEIKVTPIFQAGLLPERYANLFPGNLKTLRKLFEDQATRPLSIPHIGVVQCYAETWTEKADARNLSGVDVELLFREDQNGNFGESFVIFTKNLQSKLSDWTIEMDRIKPRPSIFDQITDVALQVLSVKDQIDLYGSLVAAKIEGLVNLIREADSQIKSLRDPDHWGIVAALHRLLEATLDLGRDVAGKGEKLLIYTVPLTMSIAQVAIALYQDTSRTVELLQLNAINNPLRIPAGTKLVYYA